MKLYAIVILLVIVGIATGLSQVGNEYITITVTSEGKAKISQTLFPKTFVSTIDAHVISEKISNLLAIDEKNILLGTTQNKELLKIATLGASSVDLKYNADILSYESGVFKLKYNSDIESRVSLPPLSKLVSLNTIPEDITDKEYILPPGDISLSFTIRPVTSQEFFVPVGDSEYSVEAITAAKIEEFSANSDGIQFIIRDKAIVLTMIPKIILENPNDALLNGEKVDFTQFHQNATHSWIRIDPHEKGLIRILDTTEKSEGGGCLIATAAYGSELAPQVQFLREIRDNQLMNTDSGASFMTGFNQLYYLFSPYIADLERENPMFKEMVKVGITPMLSSLSVMENAESESEILGLGIGIILMNVGMYFVLPFVMCHYVKRFIRTRCLMQSSWAVICGNTILTAVKKSIFGIIVLLVLSVSLSSAFQPAYAAGEEPVKMVLDMTYQNIQDSMNNLDEIPEASQTYFNAGEEKYGEAIDALEAGDIVTAKESALVAMALFENAAEEIGALENQASTQLPPGFGAGIDSASDTGITQGQGLGVGGVPPGILKQITAASTFEIQEQITEIDDEIEGLRNLIESSNLPVNLEKVNESVNLAKEVLMSGDIPNAQAKLAVAKDIKDDLYQQINEAVKNNEDERIQQFVDNSISNINEMLEKDNLGLTKKAIGELESTLAVLESGDVEKILDKTDDNSEFAKEVKSKDDPGNSENAPGQDESGSGNSENAPGQTRAEGDAPGNSGDAPGNSGDAPGNSGDAPGQNKEDSPGFGAAEDNPSDTAIENENAVGLGLGKDTIPPGQLKKFDKYESSFAQSPDDYYENSYEASIDDVFEVNFDGTNKGNGDGKGKFGAFPGKSGEAPGKFKAATKSGGNPNCGTKGITDENTGPISVAIDTLYTIEDFTAIGSNCKDVSNQIKFNMIAPNGTVFFGPNANVKQGTQPETIVLDDFGDWLIQTTVQSFRLDRIINVPGGGLPTADAGIDQTVTEGNLVTLDGTGSSDEVPGTITDYFWERINTGGPNPTLSDPTAESPTFTAPNPPGSSQDYVYRLTVTDNAVNQATDTVTITVNASGGGGGTTPSQITVFTATASSSTQIDLDWDAPADGGSSITGYEIERRGPTGPFNDISPDTWGTNTAYSDTGLDADTEYDYRITAINGVGQSPASSIISETTLSGGGGPTVPGQVGVLKATADSSSQVTLTWNLPADDGGDPIIDYLVEFKKSSDPTFVTFVDGVSSSTGAVVTSLDAATFYDFKISAINSIGSGAPDTVSKKTKN